MTMMLDARSILMYGKDHHSGQHWRIDGNGCLRNKEHPTRCLAILGDNEGTTVGMQECECDLNVQNWEYKSDHSVQ